MPISPQHRSSRHLYSADHLPHSVRRDMVPQDERDRKPVAGSRRRCVDCALCRMIPVIRQRVPCYYVSKPDGGLMLTLERREGERIRICDYVEIVVLAVRASEVKLGIIERKETRPCETYETTPTHQDFPWARVSE